jgi:hypothetical protein
VTLVELDGQYIDPDAVVAVLIPTSAHVALVDGIDLTLRSVLVVNDGAGTLVPCALTPRMAVRKLEGDEVTPTGKRQEAKDRAEQDEERQRTAQHDKELADRAERAVPRGRQQAPGSDPGTSRTS